MRVRNSLIAAVLISTSVGCSSGPDTPPPSCQTAVSHYYSVGCTFFDLSTNPPTQTPLGTSIANCQSTLAGVSNNCQDEMDDLLWCLNGVPSAANCDCTQELDTVLRCR